MGKTFINTKNIAAATANKINKCLVFNLLIRKELPSFCKQWFAKNVTAEARARD
jgi:hypothetical protein